MHFHNNRRVKRDRKFWSVHTKIPSGADRVRGRWEMRGGRGEVKGREEGEERKRGGREKEKKIRALCARRSKEGGGRQGAGGEVRGGRGERHTLCPSPRSYLLVMQKILKCCSLICIFRKFQWGGGGRGVQTPKTYIAATRRIIWWPPVWNAVLTYIQLFEDIFKYLKISSN